MAILVAYASKHGATQAIAERIGERLRAQGLSAEVGSMRTVGDLSRYEAFVLGSAVYFGAWLKQATEFVRRNREVLASQPVWLFSSGPLGSDTAQIDAAIPKQIAALTEALNAHGHQVFFGALDHTRFDVGERLLWALPASHTLLLEGDFRDWSAVDAWAESIAGRLAPMAVGGG
jgi:menaquinone-dependent protoporphyrinogen oxidase